MAKMVKVEALKTAVTTVRVGVTRQIVVTNEDKAGAKAAEEAGEQNAHTFFTTPSTTHRTFCRFGLNFRRLVPVIFLPTPPRYFALPR